MIQQIRELTLPICHAKKNIMLPSNWSINKRIKLKIIVLYILFNYLNLILAR
jgi:hypothetical protein